MPSLSTITASNSARAPLSNRYALVVGGTSGIGEAIAKRLATLKANVGIVGRNEEAGQKIVNEMKTLNPEGSYEFFKTDVSLMSNIRELAKNFQTMHNQLDYLVLTQGIFTTQGRTETKEGIDQKLALHYYGRHLMIREMIPSLLKTQTEKNTDVRVISVLAAGKGGPVGDDLELKNTFSLKRAADAASFHGDLMVDEFSIRFPTIGFIHAYPGVVNTPLLNKGSSILEGVAKLFTISPQECAEYMVHDLLSDNTKTGFHLFDKASPAQKNSHHTDEIRKKVWEHTVSLTADQKPSS